MGSGLGNTFATASGAASKTIVPENLGRFSLVMTNDSTDDVWYSLSDNAAVVGSGDKLTPDAKLIISKNDRQDNIYHGAVQAIKATAGTANVAIVEIDADGKV